MVNAILSVFISLVFMLSASAHGVDKNVTQRAQNVQQKRDQVRQNVQQKREELQGRIQQKRDQLKQRLQKVKDERKREVVERVDRRLDEFNENRVNHFLDVLDKLNEVLARIVSRADKAAARGLDVSAVRTAVTDAEKALKAARDAVQVQAGKTYTVVTATTTENQLKSDVGRARDAVHSDIKKLFGLVKAARDAVHKVAVTLAQIPRVNEEPVTTAPTSTPPATTTATTTI